MKERMIKGIAGTFVLTGLVLGYFVNEYFYLIIAFVGLNLVQTSFTKWCLLGNILGSCGVKD
ncbi:MAG: sulfurtransferase [Flavobacteriales bacterium]|nr:MAG: sulfurtransferase [Flavobacteriales bacterium]